jgi:hypothetical protein
MADSKESKLEKKMREVQQRHEWSCCYELSKVLDTQHQQGFDWGGLAKAAYHAGAAKAIQESLF